MFSSRLDWEARPNRLAEALEKRRLAGLPVLDLTESNPGRAGIEFGAGEILEALDDARSISYEPDARGLLEAREAVARYQGASPDDIVLTASTSEAYSMLFKLLCDPGGEILAPRPSYPLFDYLARLESVEVRHYSLLFHEGWWVEPGEWERRVTPRTRAIVVVNPNNPTGSYLRRGEVERLSRLCADRGIAIVSDEVFADYRLDPSPEIAPTLAGVEDALTFRLGGLSKSCGLPQMKLGWIVVGGPAATRAAAMRRLELIADTYLSVSAPVQHAAARWLARRTPFQERLLSRVRGNLEVLQKFTTPPRVEGGWYAIMRLPATRSEEDWVVDLVDRHGVSIQPGYFYDFQTEPFAIVSLLPKPEIFVEGIRRIGNALDES